MPASSIASTSPDMRSATKPEKSRVERHDLAMEGIRGGNARRWTTLKYSSRRVRLAVVVTTTNPFAWAHLKMT